MGRPVKPRDNYRADAIAVNRLITALEQDTTSDRRWVAEVKTHLSAAFELLLKHKPSAAKPPQGKSAA